MCVVHRKNLPRLNPDVPEPQRDLGGTLNNFGVLLARKGRLAEAVAMYRWAAERAESAFAQAQRVVINGRFLTIQLQNVAYIER
jgi:hypothetical protein